MILADGGFLVGNWVVDPTLGQVENRVSHAVVRLRPKSMDVLVLLARANGNLVSRKQLIETVWPETLARDESLTRCIADLRHALDQDEHLDNHLETFPKRGYRLLVKVSFNNGTTNPTEALTGRNKLPWLWLVFFIGLTGLALVSWNIYQNQTSLPVVAVIPAVNNSTATPGSELQVLAINDLLFQRLSELPELKVRGPGGFSDDKQQLEKAALMGADYAVELTPDSGDDAHKVQILVRLHYLKQKPYPSTILDRFDILALDSETDISAFLAIREQVARSILDRLMPAMTLPEDSATQPDSLLAYRLYLQARSLLVQPGCDGSGPNRLLRQSIELDPGFIPARVALGWAEYGLAATCGLGPEHYDNALKIADETLKISPSWIPALNLKATILVEIGRTAEALTLLHSAAQQMPRSAFVQFAMSYASCYAGDLASAEAHLQSTLKIDPMFLTAQGWTPNVLLYQQDFQSFLQHLPATPSTLFDYYRGFALLRLQRNQEAVVTLRRGYQTNPNDIFGQLSGALLAVQEDDAQSAVNILRALVKRRADQGALDGEVTFKIAQIAAIADAEKFSLEQLQLAWAQGFQCMECIQNDPLLNQLVPEMDFPNTIRQ